jgi:putative endonuclease
MTNQSGTLYVGVTNDIIRRVWQHEQGLAEGFTRRYRITRLVYCETFPSSTQAIAAEKVLKGWRRQKKLDLICKDNPTMLDLAADRYRDGSTPQQREGNAPIAGHPEAKPKDLHL